MGKKNFVVATIARNGGKIVMGKVLSYKPHREAEHALHALPSLAMKERVPAESLGIFCDGIHVPKPETMQV